MCGRITPCAASLGQYFDIVAAELRRDPGDGLAGAHAEDRQPLDQHWFDMILLGPPEVKPTISSRAP